MHPFDAGRSLTLGGGGDLGFLPCGCGGVLSARRNPRSMRRAISSTGKSSPSAGLFMAGCTLLTDSAITERMLNHRVSDIPGSTLALMLYVSGLHPIPMQTTAAGWTFERGWHCVA